MQGIWLVTYILQWILVLLLVVLNIGILRILASLQDQAKSRRSGKSRFGLGEKVDDFTLSTTQDTTFTSKSLFEKRRVVLFFLSSTCSPCKSVIEQIQELTQRSGGLKALGWDFILIYNGDQSAIKEISRDLASSDVVILIDENGTTTHNYSIPSTPFALAIDGRGNLYSQSSRPTSMWLYAILNIPAPDKSIAWYDSNPVPILKLEVLK